MIKLRFKESKKKFVFKVLTIKFGLKKYKL